MVIIILASCATANRMVEINDSSKGIKSFSLDQNPKAFSTETAGQEFFHTFTSTYIFEENGKNRPVVSASFQVKTPFKVDKLDSVLFINLNDEKIRIVINQPISTAKENDQLKSLIFAVPENIWASIAGADKIQYWLKFGKEEIDVNLSLPETTQLKKFFRNVGARRDTLFPAVPEGHKKW